MGNCEAARGAVQYWCCGGTALRLGQDLTLMELRYGLKNRALGLTQKLTVWLGGLLPTLEGLCL